MIGILLAALLGGGLGSLAGHLAMLVPSGRLASFSLDPRTLRSERGVEHTLGAILGAVGLALAYDRRTSIPDFLVTGVFVLLLISILIIDLRHHLVYPLMPLAGVVLGVLLNPVSGEVMFLSSFVGALLAAGAFLALFLLGLVLFRVQALGFGDVLLAGMVGSMVGFGLTPAALALGSILGAVAAVLLLLVRKKGMGDYIPFGSGMCLAAILVLISR